LLALSSKAQGKPEVRAQIRNALRSELNEEAFGGERKHFLQAEIKVPEANRLFAIISIPVEEFEALDVGLSKLSRQLFALLL